VRSGAQVVRAVLDDDVEIGSGAAVGAADGAITLVGLRARVSGDAVIGPGARYPDAGS
jgi:carbonic anhydrase/acetyltransferase-like protein (isoleucine patch superfamily)